jgi:hypothetical protein
MQSERLQAHKVGRHPAVVRVHIGAAPLRHLALQHARPHSGGVSRPQALGQLLRGARVGRRECQVPAQRILQRLERRAGLARLNMGGRLQTRTRALRQMPRVLARAHQPQQTRRKELGHSGICQAARRTPWLRRDRRQQPRTGSLLKRGRLQLAVHGHLQDLHGGGVVALLRRELHPQREAARHVRHGRLEHLRGRRQSASTYALSNRRGAGGTSLSSSSVARGA